MPIMSLLGHLAHIGLVHPDTKARFGHEIHVAVPVAEDFGVFHVFEQVVSGVIVDI